MYMVYVNIESDKLIAINMKKKEVYKLQLGQKRRRLFYGAILSISGSFNRLLSDTPPHGNLQSNQSTHREVGPWPAGCWAAVTHTNSLSEVC